jgi:serine/threonine-protein kinase
VAQADLVGVVLDGRYRVIEPIGHGAMGIVYRGERIHLGRTVAIKVLHDSLPNELAGRQRFELEARAMARLEHPHCVAVLDVGLHEGRPYVVMEMVSGDSLRDVMDGGPLDIARAASIMRQVLSGLAHAHELGIVHRDIKPANLILGHKTGLGDQVKILDFGLARSLDSTSARLTTGIVLGTPAYMAPEQCRDSTVDARSDLYACGVMLFEMLTGRKPFESAKDDPIEIVGKHLNQPPPRLADIRPDVNFGGLEGVVLRALSKDPDERFPHAQEFTEALDEAVRGHTQPVPVVEPQEVADAPVVPVPPTAPASSPMLTRAPSEAFEAPNLPPPPDAISLDPARVRKRQLQIAGGVVGGAMLFALVASMCGGGGEPSAARTPDAVVAVTPPPPPPPPIVDASVAMSVDAAGPAAAVDAMVLPDDPADAALMLANAKASANDVEGALVILAKAHKEFVANPDIPYLAGKLYFSKQRYGEGLASLREAVRLFPGYQEEPELIKLVVDAFLSTPSRNADIARFLHDSIGKPAVPYLQEQAAKNPRAEAELKRF